MYLKLCWLVCLTLLISSCAQVPKQSVELSATIGRDLITVHNSHRQLAEMLFDRMERDVNRFIDNVYMPYQIKSAMERQAELAKSTDPNQQRKSLLLAINAAFKPEASSQLQTAVLKGMASMVQIIHDDVEKKRNELLDPLKEQKKELLASIDRSYEQLQYANSVVTGYLASVVKVTDAQTEILKTVGVEQDLRKVVGENLAKTSESIGAIVEKAESVEDKIDKAEENAKKIKDKIDELKEKFKTTPKEG
jgi:uncharacterized phage infection (PIP) family protein YhgE